MATADIKHPALAGFKQIIVDWIDTGDGVKFLETQDLYASETDGYDACYGEESLKAAARLYERLRDKGIEDEKGLGNLILNDKHSLYALAAISLGDYLPTTMFFGFDPAKPSAARAIYEQCRAQGFSEVIFKSRLQRGEGKIAVRTEDIPNNPVIEREYTGRNGAAVCRLYFNHNNMPQNLSFAVQPVVKARPVEFGGKYGLPAGRSVVSVIPVHLITEEEIAAFTKDVPGVLHRRGDTYFFIHGEMTLVNGEPIVGGGYYKVPKTRFNTPDEALAFRASTIEEGRDAYISQTGKDIEGLTTFAPLQDVETANRINEALVSGLSGLCDYLQSHSADEILKAGLQSGCPGKGFEALYCAFEAHQHGDQSIYEGGGLQRAGILQRLEKEITQFMTENPIYLPYLIETSYGRRYGDEQQQDLCGKILKRMDLLEPSGVYRTMWLTGIFEAMKGGDPSLIGRLSESPAFEAVKKTIFTQHRI